MRKRIADILEKMTVAFFVGFYFQEHFWWKGFGALSYAVAAFAMCLILTRRENR
jgi:hypothetical protein